MHPTKHGTIKTWAVDTDEARCETCTLSLYRDDYCWVRVGHPEVFCHRSCVEAYVEGLDHQWKGAA